mmetsp:Transcript_13623/g.16691  ORF Transcript_13623/g.16691 Transcript_13623/m.16691 type:complete len:340 (+) Transcript_13623:857-1876(+)
MNLCSIHVEVHHGSNIKEEGLNENDKTSSSDNFSAVRKLAGQFVEHPVFVIGMIVLILINAVMMGLATFQFVKSNAEVSAIFESIDLALLIIFTIEISLQFCYIGFGIFCDGWLFFDFFVVALSWIMASFGKDSVKIFRYFRALRLTNRVEVLRNLVNAIISVIPRMGAICVLLSIVFYIFGVMFTMLFKDAGDFVELGDNYFGGLHLTLFTLFQVMTMDNWVDVTREIMVYKYCAWAPFCNFVFISGFGMIGPIDDDTYYCLAKEYGYCDRRSGTCFCNEGYQGVSCEDCSPSQIRVGSLCYPRKLCPNSCSGAGDCDHLTGLCSCLDHCFGNNTHQL